MKQKYWLVIALLAILLFYVAEKKESPGDLIVTHPDTTGTTDFYGDRYRAQTFLAPSNFEIESVKLMLRELSTPSTIYVDIMDSTFTSVLSTGQVYDIPGSITEIEITMQSATLLNGVEYAIVVYAPSAQHSSRYFIGFDNMGRYPDGSYHYSNDAGQTWIENTPWDFWFEVWGTYVSACPEGQPCGTEGTCHNDMCTWDKAKFLSKITGEIDYELCIYGDPCHGDMTWVYWPAGDAMYFFDVVGSPNYEVSWGDVTVNNPPISTDQITFRIDGTSNVDYLPETFLQAAINNLEYKLSYEGFLAYVDFYLHIMQYDFNWFINNANRWI